MGRCSVDLGLNVPDIDAARAYYGDVLPLLDYEPFRSEEDGFYPASEAGGYTRQRPGLQHLAFIVPTRTAVRRVHERVVDLGSEVLHVPREFPQYPPPYFATFWLDPLGFMLEAVCHHDRE